MLTISETLLNQIVQIAEDAGEAILKVYERPMDDVEVSAKSDDSPLTEADLAAHHHILEELKKLDAYTPVLSEESEQPTYEERKQWQQYWLVDPLDGTKEFINRNGEFTVNIALIENHEPVLGVVHVPVKGQTYCGARGLGASKIENGTSQTIKTRTMAERNGPLVVVASRRHGTEQLQKMLENVEKNIGNHELTNMGSSLKFCLLAEGKADIYPRLAPTCEWDTGAAQAVLQAAGGDVFDPNFEPFRYNCKEDLLNPHFYAVADTGFDWAGAVKSGD